MRLSAWTKALTGALVALALAGCARESAAPAPAGGLRKVVLQSDWFPQAEHGGFYQAVARGFYREAGLDVEILPGGPGATIKLNVAKGVADFGLYRSDDVVVAASRGLPLLMVGAVLQHDPEALLVHDSSPVRELRDLHGRSVIAPPSMTWIPYVQRKYGIHFDLQPLNYGLAIFLGNPDAIQQCMLTSEPYFAEQRGAKVRTIRLADSGYDPYHTIICRRELARAHPEVVRAFVAASVRGWRDFLEGDPAPAFRLIKQHNTQMSDGQLDYSRRALIAHALVQGVPEKGEDIGQIDEERIRRQIATLTEVGILDKPVKLSDVVTRAFLPPARR
ncbi:MAG TPA: ABC transporter substrate-binding protein [Opitutaceae bacterium]|nr:ABC transporter substrate-binding protein [Opitutaceae bacterium]HND62688.1 ABC transporter substrate-binding protein [Opitutaceae bacterium]